MEIYLDFPAWDFLYKKEGRTKVRPNRGSAGPFGGYHITLGRRLVVRMAARQYRRHDHDEGEHNQYFPHGDSNPFLMGLLYSIARYRAPFNSPSEDWRNHTSRPIGQVPLSDTFRSGSALPSKYRMATRGSEDDTSWYLKSGVVAYSITCTDFRYPSIRSKMSRHRVPKARDEGTRERSERFRNRVNSFHVLPICHMLWFLFVAIISYHLQKLEVVGFRQVPKIG